MTTIINAVSGTGLTQSADGSGVLKVQSNGVTTNALAWVRYNGNTKTVLASYNVSSVTYSSAGTYIVNFSNATSDANIAVLGTVNNSGSAGYNTSTFLTTATTTSTATIAVVGVTGTANVQFDPNVVCVSVFGN